MLLYQGIFLGNQFNVRNFLSGTYCHIWRLTDAGLLPRSPLKASVTFAVVGASCVDTITIGARVRGALVYIWEQGMDVLSGQMEAE